MNAYELADFIDKYCVDNTSKESAVLLRQQADRIAELEKQSEPYGWHCFEDDDDCLLVNGQNVNKPDGSWDKVIPLYTTPQTKPLSDDEIDTLIENHWDVDYNSREQTFDYKGFARAIEAEVRGEK